MYIDGRLFMNARQTALESLRSRLGQEISRTGRTTVMIESAGGIPLRFIVRVAELVKHAGTQEIRLRPAAGEE